jgi:hypothetical protein
MPAPGTPERPRAGLGSFPRSGDAQPEQSGDGLGDQHDDHYASNDRYRSGGEFYTFKGTVRPHLEDE